MVSAAVVEVAAVQPKPFFKVSSLHGQVNPPSDLVEEYGGI